MSLKSYWADDYVAKKRTGEEAVKRIRPGQRVFIGTSCGEPQHLVRELFFAAPRYTDIEIVRLLTLESTPLSLIADKTQSQSLTIRSFYLGSAASEGLARKMRFFTPMNLSAIPRLFKSRLLPIHTALIQVSPPDDFGWMSLGVSVDITLAAAMSADLVIAQINPKMPRVLGRSFIHVNDIDVAVEFEENIKTVGRHPEVGAAEGIARNITRLVEDGSTIQIGLGAIPREILSALSQKNDLGVHTHYLFDGIMHLFSRGVITNRKKGYNEEKLVASSAVGSRNLYEFLDDNPAVEFHPSDYVNDPRIIARHNRMVSINEAAAMDLTGQVAADATPYNHFSGINDILDFVRGATMADNGKSILVLPSTTPGGKESCIVPVVNDAAVVVPRGDVHYVVTEFGAVNLFGKSLQERALAMISIAHPEFRGELFSRARDMGLVGPERKYKNGIHGIYPVRMEESRIIEGQTVVIRPAKPVDERRIQEHFYNLEKSDVISRFFHEKVSFVRGDVEDMYQIDYIRDLTLVAVVGEFGFGRVIAIGGYFLEPEKNMAEIAFSVSREWQGKGLGRILIRKLAEAARENGISGMVAYTLPENQTMIRLFNSLPYKIRMSYDEDRLMLRARFDEPEGKTQAKKGEEKHG